MTFFLNENIIRSSHSRVFRKKRVLKNFTKFTGNTCVIVHFIKKETLTQVLSCKSCQTFKNTFFVEHLRWLLLYNLTLSNSLTKMLVPSLDENLWNEHEYDVSSWFTCNCAFDIVIVLMMLRYIFWYLDSVFVDCIEYLSSHGVSSSIPALIAKMTQSRFQYQIFIFQISIFSQIVRKFASSR